jgi:hypothetical protein
MRIEDISALRDAKAGRCSSWDKTGRNEDSWYIEPGETRALADIEGPGAITHIWMTQEEHYRECLLKFTWDNAARPSVLVPLGDFFCLGHGIVNSFQSQLFTASAGKDLENRFGGGCALNAYAPMPFRERARVELINESQEVHRLWFYVDYERYDKPRDGAGYFHAEFRRTNPFGGWGHEIRVNRPETFAANQGRTAWENNYVILETKGRGHYLGCNLSVTNFNGRWWGEGDDMIWVDGYKWPPDLHGTGSEDYLGQAFGMQDNAFLRNGSSIYEQRTGGYQTSYVFHLENPVPFRKSIKVTIEHGHANHLANEMASTAYWYAEKPAAAVKPPPVEKRLPVLRDNRGNWLNDKKRQCPGKTVVPNAEMKRLKARWKKKQEEAI